MLLHSTISCTYKTCDIMSNMVNETIVYVHGHGCSTYILNAMYVVLYSYKCSAWCTGHADTLLNLLHALTPKVPSAIAS